MVVLVDDDDQLIRMYRVGLERAGYRVESCGCGEQLVTLLRDVTPDVVVLDWTLPGQNGGEILEALRRDPKTYDLRVIMLSGISAGGPEAEKAKMAGAALWLDKAQTDPLKLARTVDSVFERR